MSAVSINHFNKIEIKLSIEYFMYFFRDIQQIQLELEISIIGIGKFSIQYTVTERKIPTEFFILYIKLINFHLEPSYYQIQGGEQNYQLKRISVSFTLAQALLDKYFVRFYVQIPYHVCFFPHKERFTMCECLLCWQAFFSPPSTRTTVPLSLCRVSAPSSSWALGQDGVATLCHWGSMAGLLAFYSQLPPYSPQGAGGNLQRPPSVIYSHGNSISCHSHFSLPKSHPLIMATMCQDSGPVRHSPPGESGPSPTTLEFHLVYPVISPTNPPSPLPLLLLDLGPGPTNPIFNLFPHFPSFRFLPRTKREYR